MKTAAEAHVQDMPTERLVRIGSRWFSYEFFEALEEPDPNCLFKIEGGQRGLLHMIELTRVKVLRTRLRGERRGE